MRKSRIRETLETLGICVLLAVFVGYYTYAGAGMAREWITWYRLGQESAVAEGRVLHMTAGPKGTHAVTYSYEAPGPGGGAVAYTREQEVSNAYYDALDARTRKATAGSPATVRVL